MDWAKWHDLYEVRPSLRERLVLVREQIVQALSKVAAEPVQIISICAGDGRDLIGALAATDSRNRVRVTLVESNAELVANGRAAIERAGLVDEITFRCVDATHSSSYVGISPVHIILISGVFGYLKENDVRSLILSLQCLFHHRAYVIWTRNLVEFDDGERATQVIRDCFVAADFGEEALTRTPGGVFVVGTYSFQGVPRSLPRNTTLFEFTGFDGIATVAT